MKATTRAHQRLGPRVLATGLAIGCLGLGCAVPRVSKLVELKQYREAICAAHDGGDRRRAKVADAIDQDAELYLHVRKVSVDELASVLDVPEHARSILGRAHIARVMVQTNTLPVDDVALEVHLQGQQPSHAAVPVSWESLALLTDETPPGPHHRKTYLTLGNIGRGLAALVTLGASLEYTRFRARTRTRRASDYEYEQSMPIAAPIMHALTPAHCDGIGLTSARADGLHCAGYFVVDPAATASWSIVLSQSYFATALKDQQTCRMTQRFEVDIGRPEQWDAHFGPTMRPVRAMERVGLATEWDRH